MVCRLSQCYLKLLSSYNPGLKVAFGEDGSSFDNKLQHSFTHPEAVELLNSAASKSVQLLILQLQMRATMRWSSAVELLDPALRDAVEQLSTASVNRDGLQWTTVQEPL